MKCALKFNFFLFFILICCAKLPCAQINHYVMENGMSVYILEDSTDALVRVEYSCRAGFSSQTPNNTGFFKLYTQLLKAATPQIEFTTVECNADSSRYVLTTTPSKLSSALEILSSSAFSLFYTDELLSEQMDIMKQEVTQYTESLAGFINAAIDSRIFYSAPWKHDSGIYPSLFSATNNNQARTILQDISDRWYTPQNSAIFISGNINAEKVSIQLKNTFGKYYSSYKTTGTEQTNYDNYKVDEQSTSRKFVLHHPDFSPELTQVVVQYTMLAKDQASLLAFALNNDNSKFKEELLAQTQLNIPGNEYINIACAQKNTSSRLIFQTLIQPPENKKTKINSAKQSEDFLNHVKKIESTLNSLDLISAQFDLEQKLNQTTSNSNAAMEYASQKWVSKPFDFASDCSYETIMQLFNSDTPYVFVIINSEDYKKNKKEYDSAGYKEITTKNASWYSQEMNKKIIEQFKPNDEIHYNIRNTKSNDNNYSLKNSEQILQTQLKNGISVTTKQNDFSSYCTILLSIKGGKINTANNNGFEDSMVSILSALIQKDINEKRAQGIIFGNPIITNKTDLSTSTISIEFHKDDFVAVCNAISNSIIFGDVKPVQADRAVSSKQYKKRLENGSAVSQMQSAAINIMFGNNNFSSIFDTNKDILQTTTYNSILAAYPSFLDANRYSIILCGNLCEDHLSILNNTLGMLAQNSLPINTEVPHLKMPLNKAQLVKIRHTFLTDIPAELAGPMPAVLIPTTEFLDPVMYIYKAPENGTKEAALFNAILNYLNKSIEDSILQLPRSGIQAAFFTIQNVEHKKKADFDFRTCMQSIKEQIDSPYANKFIVEEIKECWTLSQMSKTSTNSGTAELMQKGFELFPKRQNAKFYLEEYDFIQNATADDFKEVFKYLPEIAPLRLYSEDTKN